MFARKPRKPLTFRRALLGALSPFLGLALGYGAASLAIATGALPSSMVLVEPEAPARVERPSEDPRAAQIEALSRRHECSRSGLPEGVIPAHSIILDPDGRVRLASFDRGWEIYAGDAPGTLVSVCRK